MITNWSGEAINWTVKSAVLIVDETFLLLHCSLKAVENLALIILNLVGAFFSLPVKAISSLVGRQTDFLSECRRHLPLVSEKALINIWDTITSPIWLPLRTINRIYQTTKNPGLVPALYSTTYGALNQISRSIIRNHVYNRINARVQI